MDNSRRLFKQKSCFRLNYSIPWKLEVNWRRWQGEGDAYLIVIKFWISKHWRNVQHLDLNALLNFGMHCAMIAPACTPQIMWPDRFKVPDLCVSANNAANQLVAVFSARAEVGLWWGSMQGFSLRPILCKWLHSHTSHVRLTERSPFSWTLNVSYACFQLMPPPSGPQWTKHTPKIKSGPMPKTEKAWNGTLCLFRSSAKFSRKLFECLFVPVSYSFRNHPQQPRKHEEENNYKQY